ncbi:MAG: hypothetical protein AAFZ52_19395, partial [Bacteroidota bacterium]
SWRGISAGLPDQSLVSDLASGPEGDLWVSTDGDGVFRLSAGGEIWEKTSAGLPADADLNSLAVHGQRLVVGTFRKGVFYSEDYGKTWRSPVFNVPKVSVRTLLFLSDEYVLAGTDNGLYFSANGGKAWTLRQSSAQINDLYLRGETLYIARADGLFASLDMGVTTTSEEVSFAIDEVFANDEHLFVLPVGGDIYRRPLVGMVWEKPTQRTLGCMEVDNNLPSAVWSTFSRHRRMRPSFRPVPGGAYRYGFRRLLETKDAWVAAVLPLGC